MSETGAIEREYGHIDRKLDPCESRRLLYMSGLEILNDPINRGHPMYAVVAEMLSERDEAAFLGCNVSDWPPIPS